jgi:hypothetical protein
MLGDESVLQRFEEANLQLHPGIYTFAQSVLQYLVFALSERGVSASPDRLKACITVSIPKKCQGRQGVSWFSFLSSEVSTKLCQNYNTSDYTY